MPIRFKSFPVPSFFLRNILWLYLFYHGYLHFREFLSLGVIVILWVGSLGLGFLSCRVSARFFPFRLLPPLLGASFAPFLLYYLCKGLLGVWGPPDVAWDRALLSLDRIFFFMILPVELLSVSTVLFLRVPVFRGLETALRGFLLGALFFTEGNFHLRLYPHPLPFAISVSAFLIGELVLLVLTAEEDRTSEEVSATQGGVAGNKPTLVPPTPPGDKAGKVPSKAFLVIRKGIPLIFLLLLVLYLSYDRYTASSLQARGGLLKAELFRFDFTHYLTLETEIRQTRDLVLLYRRSEPIDRYLLKRYLLEGYAPGRGFYKDPYSPDPTISETVPPHPLSFPLRETKGRKPIKQWLYLLNLDPGALLSLDYPTRLTPYRNWPKSSFSRVYEVEAMALTILPLELSEVRGPGMDPKTLAYYTEHGQNRRLRALAEEITRGIETYYDKVQAIADYLKYDYYYSLKPGKAPDGDQLAHFLFTGKKGYCSYFAFSMALLCRSLGIPARVAIGFFIDPEMELFGYYPVHSDMAHAWVEVYFEGYGWVDFDPTSRTPAPGEQPIPGSQMKRSTFTQLLREILTHSLEAEPLPPSPQKSPMLPIGSDGSLYRTLEKIVRITILPLGISAFLLYRFRYRVKGLLHRSFRDKVSYRFWAFLQELAVLGFTVSADQSLKEALDSFLQSHIPVSHFDEHMKELFNLYQEARFGEEFTWKECRLFFTLLRETRKELLRRARPLYRILQYIHPATFRRPLR